MVLLDTQYFRGLLPPLVVLMCFIDVFAKAEDKLVPITSEAGKDLTGQGRCLSVWNLSCRAPATEVGEEDLGCCQHKASQHCTRCYSFLKINVSRASPVSLLLPASRSPPGPGQPLHPLLLALYYSWLIGFQRSHLSTHHASLSTKVPVQGRKPRHKGKAMACIFMAL